MQSCSTSRDSSLNGSDNYVSANSSSCSTSPSLLLRACGGESLAWQRMVQIYGPLVYNWARRTGLQPQDAADVAQETFAAVSTRLSRFDPQQAGATFRGWLWTITRNKAADFVRARDAQPRARGGSDPAREFAELFSPSGSTYNHSGDALCRFIVENDNILAGCVAG
ncbi:MAG: sigma-70 family RNA polymerase sigma factor [Pirellulaceae bacterium]|jgi:DNA-directed RNA polymerase specialized sigma24 family protein|nr:sigma-70 family RNA polymerase sigma factor [Pirellulaceae bacterium]